MDDTSYYDVIAQDREWDAQVGRGSFCCFVSRLRGGKRPRPNLEYAQEIADRLQANEPWPHRYYTVTSGGRIFYSTRSAA